MSERPAGADEGGAVRCAVRLAALLLPLAALAWIGSGVRRVDPASEISVVSGDLVPFSPRRIEGAVAVVPPGLLRLDRYPATAADVALPGAEEARLVGKDGSTFGLRGSARVRVLPDRWEDAVRAAGGEGIRGVIAASVRASAGEAGSLSPREPMRASVSVRLQKALGAALLQRGVELLGLEVAGFDLLAVPKGTRASLADTRLLILGLDGADWAILDPLLAQGRLPNLSRLIREGVRAKLLTISPALSPVVWTTIATGVDPARHGILDFLVPGPEGGEGQPVTSRQRKAPAVWEMLSEAGARIGNVAWWATWPADPVEGYLVTDRVAYQLFGARPDAAAGEGKTWPPDLYESEVRPRIVPPEATSWEEVRQYLRGPRTRPEDFDGEERKLLDDFRTLLAATRTYVDVALALRSQGPLDFESVYVEGTDTVGHLFMPYRPPKLAGVDPGRFEAFRDVVDAYYETADREVGRLLEGRGRDWTVLVLSDHGFASDASRPLTTDSRIGHGPAADWHRRFGVLILSGAHVRAGARLEEASVYDVAPTILALFGQPVPTSWPGSVLTAALDPAFLEKHPLRYREDAPTRPGIDASPDEGRTPALDPEAAELREKLRSLGYLGSSEGAPVRATTRNNTGIALLAQGKIEAAIAEFRAGIEDEPRNAVLLVNLGTALRLRGDREEARAALERALTVPATRRAAGHQLAQLCMDSRDLDGAERHLRGVLEAEPGAADVVNSLGLVLEKKGREAEAEAHYRRAADVDPDAAEPRANLGNLARSRGDLDAAEAWYRSAIEADPYFMGAYNNLALVYQDRGDDDKAIELYDRALAKSPDHAVVLNNLGSIFFERGDVEDARRSWSRAAALDPRYPSPLNNLAGLEISEGNLEAARGRLLRALELDPHYGDARVNLALLLRKEGKAEDARAEILRALEDPRSRKSALLQAGIEEIEAGRPREALAYLDEARAAGVRDPMLWNATGECYRKLGRPREAIGAWEESLRIDPSQGEVRAAIDTVRSAGPSRAPR